MPNPDFPRGELFHESLGIELRIAAEEIDLTIPEISIRAHLNEHTVRRIMKHSRPATLLETMQICRVVDLDVSTLSQRALARAFSKQREMEKFERSIDREMG
ncbi:hypothetical protein [Agreia sp. COWG]|uniref:hypothetical protein n=1 Tax=Agreia sp. COWG TaxID=2773266 RepID=UPI0019277E6D|nr:hypothetical protein [Agreia sp. COWG]